LFQYPYYLSPSIVIRHQYHSLKFDTAIFLRLQHDVVIFLLLKGELYGSFSYLYIDHSIKSVLTIWSNCVKQFCSEPVYQLTKTSKFYHWVGSCDLIVRAFECILPMILESS